MAATLRYGRERAHIGRSLLNFMRIARNAHAPDLTLGEVGDLLFTAIEVFIGHAFERPMALNELSRNLEMPRDAVRRKLQRLIEIGLVAQQRRGGFGLGAGHQYRLVRSAGDRLAIG